MEALLYPVAEKTADSAARSRAPHTSNRHIVFVSSGPAALRSRLMLKRRRTLLKAFAGLVGGPAIAAYNSEETALVTSLLLLITVGASQMT